MGSLSKKRRSEVAKKAAAARRRNAGGAKGLTLIALKAWKTRRKNEKAKSRGKKRKAA